MRKTNEVERSRFGCKYCADSTQNGKVCKNSSCPYKQEFSGFKTYAEYYKSKKYPLEK